MSRIFVTGASGFIGKHFCKLLGPNALPISRSVHGPTLENLPSVRDDFIVHLGGCNDVKKTSSHLNQLTEEALETGKNILKHPFKKVLLVSSGLVYGTSPSPKAFGETDPARPENPYSRLKIQIEDYFGRDPRTTVARVSNVLGRGMPSNNVFSDILNQLQSNKPVKLRDLRPVRDFVSVKDVCEALLGLLNFKQTGIFNVGTGEGHSIQQISEKMLTLWEQQGGSTKNPVESQNPDSIPSYLILNIDKIKTFTPWRPKYSWVDEVKELLAKG